MKNRRYITIYLFCFCSIISAQEFNFSVNPFYSFSNKNLQSSYGLQLGLEYFTNERISFNLSGGFFSPDNNLENQFLVNMPTTITWFSSTVKVYPINSKLNPFFGVGLVKYFLNRDWDGHTGSESLVFNGNLDDCFGGKLVAGMKIYKKIYFELNYLLIPTEMDRTFNEALTNIVDEKNVKVNLNSVLVIISFKF